VAIAGGHLAVRRRRPADQRRLAAGELQGLGRVEAGVGLLVHGQIVVDLFRRGVHGEDGAHDVAVGAERGGRAEYLGVD
jgi:hypothetical protein